MALQSAFSKIWIRDALDTQRRRFEATATVQDTAAGSSVTVTITHRRNGGTPPAAPATLELSVRIDNGSTVIRTFTLDPTNPPADDTPTSQQVTFHFTNDGTSGGSPRSDTVRMRLRAALTGVNAYDVTSDEGQFGSAANSYQAGFQNGGNDWGYLRGTDTLVEDISNTSLGGAPSSPAEYDESLFVRLTSGAASYTARALSVSLTHGSLSGSTNSTTSATRDLTFSNVVDERFPLAATTVGLSVTVPNAALTGLPAWTYTSTTDDTLVVDPRLTASHHFQVDDDVFGTAKNVASKAMLSVESGFLWTRLTGSRGTGINSLTVTQTLDPTNPGTTISNSTSTATRDSQAGWTDKLDWTASKPGGTWAKTVDVTAPSDIDSDSYLVSGTDTLTMIASNPNFRLVCGGGPGTVGTDTKHFVAGQDFIVGLVVFNTSTMQTIALDTGTPAVFIGRLNLATGQAEYLDSDGTTWVPATGTTVYGHALTVSPADANLYTKTFSAATTAGWGVADIFVIGKCTVGGVPVNDFAKEIVVSGINNHDRYAFDGAGFVGFPSR